MQPGFQDLSFFTGKHFYGRSSSACGLQIPGQFALRVVQQPAGNYTYISSMDDVVTQLQSAERYGVTGLLAHNYLAGKHFLRIQIGQRIQLIHRNGAVCLYHVSEIASFQRIIPNCSTSDLVDLSNGNRLSHVEVFDRFYSGDHHLTLQTCLAKNGLDNFGLVFLIGQRL